jgi:glycosyltransferase involved in cell wall biosynthesis
MTKKKKISILITNFNKCLYLENCINSCLKQNYPNFEIIIADNESTDNSLALLQNKYSKIKLLNVRRKYSTPALNQINCINKLINISTGEIICLLDGDDVFMKNKLNSINNFYCNKKNNVFVYDIPKLLPKNKKYILKKRNDFIWSTIIPTSSISFKKIFFYEFIKYSFFKDIRFSDLEIDFRINVYSKFILRSFPTINNTLTGYRIVKNGIMSSYIKYSFKWWKKRFQAHMFIEQLHFVLKKKYKKNMDYYISKFIYTFFFLRKKF